jgi:hypothetical protein
MEFGFLISNKNPHLDPYLVGKKTFYSLSNAHTWILNANFFA